MKIVEKTEGEDLYNDGTYTLEVFNPDGKKETEWRIGAGEPEDMNLARDLNCAYFVVDLMRLAYEAGKRGEEFKVKKHPDSMH